MKKVHVLIVLTSLLISSVQAQMISGVVKDKKTNEPLIGATVVLTEINKGKTTDLNGKFSFNLKQKKEVKYTLKVSFLGYKTKTISVLAKKDINIFLEEENNILEEVVVTSSYGTKKIKEEVVGSISTIKTKEIVQEQNSVSFEELLEGQVTGLNIEINPELGEAVSIDIRGKGSLPNLNANVIGTSTQPLIIVDGVILSEEVGIEGSNFFDIGTGNLSENILNPLAKIGIQDIESINVLKDAAAVGIYGADAANGVILITTKEGKPGKIRFHGTVQTGISTAMNRFKYLNGEQYQDVVNSYNINSGFPENAQQWNGVNTNWFDLLNKTGTFVRYNLGASGGNNNWLYRLNIGFQKNNESQVNNDYQKINTSLSLKYKQDKLSFSLKTAPSFITKNNPNTLYNFALPPTISPYEENGDYTFFATYGNPLAVANQNKAEAKTFNLLTSLVVNYDITPDVSISSIFGMDFSYKDEDKFFSGLNGSGQFNDGSLGRRVLRTRNTKRFNWSGSIAFDKVFDKKHYVDGLLATEIRSEDVDLTYHRGDGYSNPGQLQPIESATKQDFQSDYSEQRGLSFFSQIGYNYDKKYFLLFNFRTDQSSAFGGDNNTAINGGFGASWNISNETFLSDNEFIDFLRLRFSYGTTGNSRIGSYRALGLYTLFDNGYNANSEANLTSLPNPNLGWERNTKFNVGVDLHFSDKFRFVGEVFRDNISDIIISRSVIPEVGLSNVQINGATMYNEGVELSLSSKWIDNEKFKFSSNFFFTKIRNKVTDLQGLGSEFSIAEVARAQRIGYSSTTIWGFNFAGIDTATGNELYSVDGQIYDATTLDDNFDQNDWEPIGDSQPDFYGGLNNRFTYKNFSLDVNFSYSYGADILLQRTLLDNYNVLFNRNLSVNIFEDSWRNQGDLANYSVITRNRRIISNTSKYIFDTSHIKLKTINMRYQFPVGKMNLPLDEFSVFLNGSNLMYWFKNESPNGKNGVAEYRNVYPEMRTISFGLNVAF